MYVQYIALSYTVTFQREDLFMCNILPDKKLMNCYPKGTVT